MSKLSPLAVALMVIPAPAFAQIVVQDSTAVATPAPSKAPVKSDLDKIVCRSQDTLGSRLERHQVCMTKQQWWTEQQDAQLKTHEMKDLGLTSH